MTKGVARSERRVPSILTKSRIATRQPLTVRSDKDGVYSHVLPTVYVKRALLAESGLVSTVPSVVVEGPTLTPSLAEAVYNYPFKPAVSTPRIVDPVEVKILALADERVRIHDAKIDYDKFLAAVTQGTGIEDVSSTSTPVNVDAAAQNPQPQTLFGRLLALITQR